MFLDGLEIPGDAPKVATFKRNGGSFAPDYACRYDRRARRQLRVYYYLNNVSHNRLGLAFASGKFPGLIKPTW